MVPSVAGIKTLVDRRKRLYTEKDEQLLTRLRRIQVLLSKQSQTSDFGSFGPTRRLLVLVVQARSFMMNSWTPFSIVGSSLVLATAILNPTSPLIISKSRFITNTGSNIQ